MRSNGRLRSAPLLIAATLSGGVARAQLPSYPPPPPPPQQARQQRPRAQPQQPQQPDAPYYPGYPYNASGPTNQNVQQRNDSENPKLRFRQPTDPTQASGNPKRPTVVEAASSTSGAGRVQVESPATRQRTATPSQVEQLIQRSQGSIDFFELVDDIMDEIARQLGREDAALLSPMAIKLVRLSSNLRPEFARTLETRLIARLSNATNVKMAICPECTARALARRGRQLGR